jgi:hypothetical protein
VNQRLEYEVINDVQQDQQQHKIAESHTDEVPNDGKGTHNQQWPDQRPESTLLVFPHPLHEIGRKYRVHHKRYDQRSQQGSNQSDRRYFMNSPMMPGQNKSGTNGATFTSVPLSTGKNTSPEAFFTASLWKGLPRGKCGAYSQLPQSRHPPQCQVPAGTQTSPPY